MNRPTAGTIPAVPQVLYLMSWAITDSVGTQLWLDRTCRVNLNYSG